MPKPERLVIDGRGTEKIVHPVEPLTVRDKKTPVVDTDTLLTHLAQARKISQEMEVGQREATVEIHSQHPDLPYQVWLHNDVHLGSVHTDVETYRQDLETVQTTPNFGVISNGDEIDNFMVTAGRAAQGVYENPINPGQQAKLVGKILGELDDQGKLLAVSFGNHNDWIRASGYTFEDTTLADLGCPVFPAGGELTVKYGGQEYKVAVSHLHWGNSKLNPTNAAKRMLEHDHPDADVLYLGHTHQKEVLRFTRAGKEHVAVIGGTYKVDDTFGSKHGLGSTRGNLGGVTLSLYPDEHKVVPHFSVDEAADDFETRLERKKAKGKAAESKPSLRFKT